MIQFGFRLSDGSYFARSDLECVGIICYLQASGAWDGVWPQQLSPSSTDGPNFVQQFLIFCAKKCEFLVPVSGTKFGTHFWGLAARNNRELNRAPNLVPISGTKSGDHFWHRI